jgi:PAS domain S-box-containing protein
MSTPGSPPAAVPRAPDLATLVAQLCGILTAGIGATALIGWIAGIEALRRVNTAFVPTAPSTALSFLLLGAAAFALGRWPDRRAARLYVDAAALLVCALTALVIAQFVGDLDLGLEKAFLPAAQTFLGPSAGRMSPLAAAGILLSALALIALTTYPSETPAGHRVAVGMGLGTLAIGAASLAGYGLGAPLLYNSVVVPVALPSAAGLSLLGAGILATAIRSPHPGAGGGAPRGRRPPFMRYIPAALGAGAVILLTVVAAGILRRLDQTRLQDAFEAKAQSVAAVLQSDLNQGLTSVRSVAAAITIDDSVTWSEFRVFATASRPARGGAAGVAWVPRIPAEARTRFEAAARRDGRPLFRFTERGAAGRSVDAGRRPEYLPVADVEPASRYQALLGFDLATEPAAADAIRRAREPNALAVSAGFAVTTDTSSPIAVIAVAPIVRETPRPAAADHGTVRGYAVGIFRLPDLVRAADPELASEGIALTLRDMQSLPPQLLFGGPPAPPARPFLAHAETLSIADHRWLAEFTPTAPYPPLHPRRSEWALLAGGLLFAFVIGAHLFGMERYSADLESARETLHISESRFRAISESAADGIITVDAHGTIVHCNAAAMREFGYAEGGLLGRNVRDLVPASHVAAHTAGLDAYRATGQALIVGETLELPALRRDGSEFPVELSLATWETHEGRFATAILRDVTERKGAQEERERLIVELREALAHVKTLSGLLPVCSWCRKVLDDRGAWRQMEAYVSEHTNAEFSHGICPECARKHLGDDS